MALRSLVHSSNTLTGSTSSSTSNDIRGELIYGIAWLATALFFFAWSGVDWVIFLAGAVLMLTGGRLFQAFIAAGRATIAGPAMPRPASVSISSLWRVFGLIAVLLILIVLAAVRVAEFASGATASVAGSPAERWLPLLLSVPIPLSFFASGCLHRVPRHVVAGAFGLAGAVTGPLLAIAWRDSLALAAAVLGAVLLATGGIAVIRSNGQSIKPERLRGS